MYQHPSTAKYFKGGLPVEHPEYSWVLYGKMELPEQEILKPLIEENKIFKYLLKW